MVRDIWRAPIWIGVALLLGLFYLASQFTNNVQLSEYIRTLQSAVCLAVVFAYGPEAWRASLKRKPLGEDILTAGIFIGWLGVLITSFYALVWRLAGSPAWMVMNTDVLNMIQTFTMYGAVLHVIGPGAFNGVPSRGAWVIGLAVGGGFLALSFLGVLRPNTAAFTERVRPYLEERHGSQARSLIWNAPPDLPPGERI